jgi:hypothetical protein
MSAFFFQSHNPAAVVLRVLSLPLAFPLIAIGQLMAESLNPNPQNGPDGAGTLGQAIRAYIKGEGDDQ